MNSLRPLASRPVAFLSLGLVVSAAIGDALRRRRALPGLGRIARSDGYTYRYATRGPKGDGTHAGTRTVGRRKLG